MRKIIGLYLLIIFLFLFSKAVSGQNQNFTVTQEPEEVFWFKDKDRKIKLTIRYKESNYFLEKIGYTFVIWFKKHQEGDFSKERSISTKGNTTGADKIDIIEKGQGLEVYVKKLGWGSESGWWPYWIYAGTGKDYRKASPIYRGKIDIPPCHRDTGCPTTFTIYNTQFRGTLPITFEIVDPNPDRKYKLWFDGEDKKGYIPSKNLTLWQEPTPQEPFPFEPIPPEEPHSVYIGTIDAPKARDKPYTLCFSEGDGCDFAKSGIFIVTHPTDAATNSAVISIRYGEVNPSLSIDPTPTRPPLPCARGLDKEGKETDDPNLIVKCIAVDTAVGEIKIEPFEFVTSVMGTLLGLAGGIAIVLIIIGGYRLMASQGNPEAVQAAREQITSAIVGLLFIIFSFVILEVIGVDILRIPGFEG